MNKVTMEEKLTEILENYYYRLPVKDMLKLEAKHLISKGVIVPPCKVGQTVFVVWLNDDSKEYEIAEHTVEDVSTKTIWLDEEDFYYPYSAIGKELFYSMEEAEKELKKKVQ